MASVSRTVRWSLTAHRNILKKRVDIRDSRRVAAATVLLVAATPCGAQRAQFTTAYPLKALRVLVGFPPGGPVDLQARIVMQKLSSAIGQPVVIDNRAGADGALANEIVAKSPADGYTLLYGSAGHVINHVLRGKALPYDTIRDFAPVGILTGSPYLLVAYPQFPANNVSELIALAKTKPGAYSYASSGSGSTPHLAGEYLKMVARIDLVHVPYKGAALGMNDVLGGHLPLTILGPPPVLPYIKSGRLKALAVTTAQRFAVLPQVPAIAEAGFPNFEVAAWYGFYAPANTPGTIVTRLNRELIAVLATPDVRERLALLGLEVTASTPQAHAAHIQAELARWTPVIKASGMRID